MSATPEKQDPYPSININLEKKAGIQDWLKPIIFKNEVTYMKSVNN